MKMNSPDKTLATDLARNLAISIRPRMILLSWTVYSCVVVASNGVDIKAIIIGLIMFIAIYGIVTLHNDLSDIETDRMNLRQDIPYAAGKLSSYHLTYTMLALSVVASFAGSSLNFHVLPLLGLYVGLGYIYSGPLNVKSRGTYAALLLGFCYGAMPWLIGGSITSQLDNANLLGMAFVSFVFSSGIIVIKDFKDVIGDTATRKDTILVRHGALFTRRYYLTITSLAYALLIAFSCFVEASTVLTVTCATASIINYRLLATKVIFSSSKARSVRGDVARSLFFICALVVYLTNTLEI